MGPRRWTQRPRQNAGRAASAQQSCARRSAYQRRHSKRRAKGQGARRKSKAPRHRGRCSQWHRFPAVQRYFRWIRAHVTTEEKQYSQCDLLGSTLIDMNQLFTEWGQQGWPQRLALQATHSVILYTLECEWRDVRDRDAQKGRNAGKNGGGEKDGDQRSHEG